MRSVSLDEFYEEFHDRNVGEVMGFVTTSLSLMGYKHLNDWYRMRVFRGDHDDALTLSEAILRAPWDFEKEAANG